MKRLLFVIGLIAATSQVQAETLDDLAHRDKDAAIESVLPLFLNHIQESEEYKTSELKLEQSWKALHAAINKGDHPLIKHCASDYAKAYGELEKAHGYAKGLAAAMVVNRIMRPIESNEDRTE